MDHGISRPEMGEILADVRAVRRYCRLPPP